MDVLFLVPQLARGLVVALLLSAAMAVVLLMFAGGYWYFVTRNHQADDPTQEYEDERGSRG
ncbi:MAG TPA: hypothetical protein VHG70_05960 [Nocardioidaceae bacterium]|nr:hypothetical protein [Nocardioidaceae bacterium]